MSDFKAKMHQIRFRLGRRGAYSAEGVRIEAPTVTELKFSVTVQDVVVVSSRMCPKITKDVAKK